jgi:hypothetical protein
MMMGWFWVDEFGDGSAQGFPQQTGARGERFVGKSEIYRGGGGNYFPRKL